MNNKKIEGADQMNEPQLFNFKGQRYFINKFLNAPVIEA